MFFRLLNVLLMARIVINDYSFIIDHAEAFNEIVSYSRGERHRLTLASVFAMESAMLNFVKFVSFVFIIDVSFQQTPVVFTVKLLCCLLKNSPAGHENLQIFS